MVERYIINYDERGEQLHPSGDFVHYSDYAALEAQLAEAWRKEGFLAEKLKQAETDRDTWKERAMTLRLSALEATPPAPKDPWPVHYANTTAPGRFAPPAPKVTEDMVERLLAYRPTNEWGDKVHHVLCDEAAAHITTLQEDNARLREALLDANENGLIYWEPNTDRGRTKKAEMIERIQSLTAAQEAGKP
jgi:hypothetical protein